MYLNNVAEWQTMLSWCGMQPDSIAATHADAFKIVAL